MLMAYFEQPSATSAKEEKEDPTRDEKEDREKRIVGISIILLLSVHDIIIGAFTGGVGTSLFLCC